MAGFRATTNPSGDKKSTGDMNPNLFCQAELVYRALRPRYGVPEGERGRYVWNTPSFRVLTEEDPEGRPQVVNIYYLAIEHGFSKSEVKVIRSIITELGTYELRGTMVSPLGGTSALYFRLQEPGAVPVPAYELNSTIL
jgi:hypothetical protein